jgi:hypothetical protein
VLLQEVDYRERYLRLTEVTLLVSMLQEILNVQMHQLPFKDENASREYRQPVYRRIEKLLEAYEAELFQDRYLPEYQQYHREVSRREKEAEAERRRKAAELMEKVSALDAEE